LPPKERVLPAETCIIHVDLGAFQQFENNVGMALLACPEKGGISTIISLFQVNSVAFH
jgi:hypothetical protein